MTIIGRCISLKSEIHVAVLPCPQAPRLPWLCQGTVFKHLHKYKLALCQQNCESFCIAVNQMQVSSAIWPCDRNTFKSKISHKEETKLPWNAKIQETDPLFSLQFGVWCFIYANHQNFYVPFGCWISLWKLKKTKNKINQV